LGTDTGDGTGLEESDSELEAMVDLPSGISYFLTTNVFTSAIIFTIFCCTVEQSNERNQFFND
jgi:hypothetical protein